MGQQNSQDWPPRELEGMFYNKYRFVLIWNLLAARKMKILYKIFIGINLLGLILILSSPISNAQKPLAEHGKWTAYTITENGRKVCYMFSRPIRENGNYKRRGDAFSMVTRRQGDRTSEDISVTSGYPYNNKKPVEINIDGKKYVFNLLQGEYAWSEELERNPQIIKAMAKGNRLKVRGVSKKGTYSLDTYSLKGFTATYKSITKACP
ncbi:MAG: hypothetical protein CMM30_02655 [Rhodospirillaceae bacterium]|nr:hypothetical protein [Alphaproteobacteria bacterium]MBR71828.1 hypothetical protein [Rhodospirillaceae bacterium]|tara:strand:+ start:14358 stop:14981 length:624 start_codon:yes stop_codon:yes gene_type:complete